MRTTRAKTPLATDSFGLRPGPFTPVALLLCELKLMNGSSSSSASHYSPSTSIQCLLYEPLLSELKLLKGSNGNSANHSENELREHPKSHRFMTVHGRHYAGTGAGYGFSGWSNCNPHHQDTQFSFHTKSQPKRTDASREINEDPSDSYI